MLKCGCGYMGVNLIPNSKRGTADCPGCGIPFKGIPAERALSDDFSKIKVGDKLYRYYRETAWDAIVAEITETEIVCTVKVDQSRTMRFDRITGVSLEGHKFGFITKTKIH